MFMRLRDALPHDIASGASHGSGRCRESSAPSSCAVISRRASPRVAERHRIGAFLQPLGPYRESVAIPVENLHPVAAPVGEHEQMSGERIQLHALVTSACRPSKLRRMSHGEVHKIYAHARRQVDHAVPAAPPAPVRSVAASAPGIT